MRREEFKDWLTNIYRDVDGNKLDAITIAHQVGELVTLYNNYERDLDKEFQKDGIKSVMNAFPSIKSYQTALNHYRKFCETNPPK